MEAREALTASERLELATREARGLLNDLMKERKRAVKVVQELKEAASDVMKQQFEEQATAIIEEGMKDYSEALHDSMNSAVDRIHKQFDDHVNVLLTGRKDGKGDNILDDIISRVENMEHITKGWDK